MDDINSDWLVYTGELADKLEAGEIGITEFSNDQLQWLVYYNFGYSGAWVTKETQLAEAELIRRGTPYNSEYAELIVEKAEEFY